MRVASSTYVPHAALPNLHAECCAEPSFEPKIERRFLCLYVPRAAPPPPYLHAECCAEPLCSGYASLVITLSVFIRLTCGLQIERRFLCLYVPRAASPPPICTPSAAPSRVLSRRLRVASSASTFHAPPRFARRVLRRAAAPSHGLPFLPY
jgi:hypothetical protein